jgi:hypothetical protein
MKRFLRAKVATGILLAVLVVSLLGGCVRSPGGVAPSNTPLEGRSYRKVGETGSTDSSIWILGILPVTGSNTIRECLDAAMRKKSADALIDITVESYAQFWFLFIRYVTYVRGVGIQFED